MRSSSSRCSSETSSGGAASTDLMLAFYLLHVYQRRTTSSSRTRLPRRPDPGRTDPHGLCRPTGRDRAALHSGASPLEPHSPDWVPPLDVHRSQSDLRLSLALRLPSSS